MRGTGYILIPSLMGLGVRCNDEVMVRIEGGNEDAAYDDMKQYFEANL